MNELAKYIKRIAEGEQLTEEESTRCFHIMMTGGATPAQMAGFLIALKMRGETVDEIAGAVKVMRAKSGKVIAPDNAIDTCGTGGDASGSYNISTAVAFVVAGCGVPVAKHGNKAISSKSGSADVLQSLGVNIEADKLTIEHALSEAGICFMMAPKFHTAMRHVAPVRAELGIRTIFNILGPLSNPAQTSYQLLGVYSRELMDSMARVLAKMGTKRAWIVHGSDGMDELTTTAISYVTALNDGEIESFEIDPEQLGLDIVEPEALKGGNVRQNAEAIKQLLINQGSEAYRDVVLLNSAAALVVAQKAESMEHGLELSRESLEGGHANKSLLRLVEYSNQ